MGTDRDRGAGWAGFPASYHHLCSRAFPVPPVRSRASSCESSSPVSSKSKIRPFSAILSRWVVEEPDTAAQFLLDAFDRPERLSRIRALVVAVLQDQPSGGRAADVVNRLIDRLHGRLVVLPYHVSRHVILRVPRAASARRPCSGIGLGSSRLCVAAAWSGAARPRLKEMPCVVMNRLTPVRALSHLPVVSRLCQSAGGVGRCR
jgi:hypothetical protein